MKTATLPLLLVLWLVSLPVEAMTFRDWVVPNKVRDTQFRFDFSTGVNAPLVGEDPNAGIKLPLYVGFDIVLVDEHKRMRMVPFAGSMSYLQNGRGRQFDSVSYGQTVGLIEGEVFFLPRWHFLYETALYRAGLEHHVGSAGLQMGLGFRYAFWAPSTRPVAYGQNHLHLFVQPLSIVWLGRLDLAAEFGTERLVIALNGAAGLQGAVSPARWLTLQASSNLYLNYNLQQSLLWRNEVAAVLQAHPAVQFRVDFRLQVPLRPLILRTNVYEAYFLDNPSFSVGVQLLWLFSSSMKYSGGVR